MGDALKSWVSNKLHDVMGMSDSTVAEYLIRITQRLPSKRHVLGELQEEIPIDNAIEKFVGELWDRVNGKFRIEIELL